MTALTDLLAGRIDPGVYTWRPQGPPTKNATETTPHELPRSTAQPSTAEPADKSVRTTADDTKQRPHTRAAGSATPAENTEVASAPAATNSDGVQKALETQSNPPPRSSHGTDRGGEAMAWAAEAARAGWRPIELNGRGVADKEAFLRRCADAFGFPEWFGMNWDALEDSLTDLDWLPARTGYLVVYDSWDQLASADPGSFRTALDVFAEAVESWRDSATPMAVLLPTTETITGLPRLN